MNKIKTTIAVAFAALLTLTAVVPASAARVYNRDTNTWEEASAVHAGRKGSSIRKEIVEYSSKFKPGTIVVETSERRLYLVLEGGKAMKYGRVAGLDPAGADAQARAGPAGLHAGRPEQSARCQSALYRFDALPHSRYVRALDHRPGRIVGVHPPHQRGRHRSL
jgi:hypothetical protein